MRAPDKLVGASGDPSMVVKLTPLSLLIRYPLYLKRSEMIF